MNWDHLMIAKAKAEGWQLITIIDNGTTHPYLGLPSRRAIFF